MTCEVLVVGAGPAGLSAAAACAESGAATVVLDENQAPGGQIWRASGALNPNALQLAERARRGGAEFVTGATVYDVETGGVARYVANGEAHAVGFKRAVLATGARELFLPFPGWTLPNVMGAGGLQAIVKAGLRVGGARVVVAGSGPLIPEVAHFLAGKGAQVVGIYEQAPFSRLNRFAAALLGRGAKLLQAAGMLSTLRKVKADRWVTRALGEERVEAVEVTDGRSAERVACDFLATAYGFVPNIELPMAAGCRIENGYVAVDSLLRTSVSNIYCAGEPTLIGGVDLSLVEGEIAGYAAAGAESKAKSLTQRRERHAAFGRLLAETFALRPEVTRLADDETIVCRCEDVAFGRLSGLKSAREAKIYSRCGMGPCQGRVCGAATRAIFGWEQLSVHAPVTPVPLLALATESAGACPALEDGDRGG